MAPDYKKPNKSGEQDKKGSAYPIYPLEDALKIAQAVSALGGARSPVSKQLLAKHLKYAETGPSFVQRIAAAKTFGMIDGWGSYTLTDRGREYFFPTAEGNKAAALKSFFSTPTVFKMLITRFSGTKLPTNELISNILHDQPQVPSSWTDKLASFFVRGAQFSGFLDANGVLGYNSEMQSAKEHVSPIATIPPSVGLVMPDEPSPITAHPNKAHASVWVHRQIRLETPENMGLDLWEKLNAYVQVLKPSKNETI